MSEVGKTDILNLGNSERIQLVEDIRDSIVQVPEQVPSTDEQKAELDGRLDAYHRIPEKGSPWEIVRERILNRG